MSRAGRTPVTWDINGVDNTATVSIRLPPEDDWRLMAFDGKQATMLFAGPDFVNPGSALVIDKTTWCELRVVYGTFDQAFDGGYVLLLP